jgi:Flp pilus assembly protein TadG
MNDNEGSVAVEFAAGLALLVLPVAVIVLMLPTWLQTQQHARDAARQGARLAVTSSAGSDEVADAVEEQLSRDGVATQNVHVTLTSTGAGVEVRFVTPVVHLPFLGEVGGFVTTARHAELFDPYRSQP